MTTSLTISFSETYAVHRILFHRVTIDGSALKHVLVEFLSINKRANENFK
jgi:hypothetical protein